MIAYFDCFSGISGDMTLSALIDLGLPVEWLTAQLQQLPIGDFRLEAPSILQMGIRGRQLSIHLPADDHHHGRHFADIKEMIAQAPFSDAVKALSIGIFDCLATAEARIHGVAKDAVHFHEVGAVDSIIDTVGVCLGLEWLGIRQVYASPIPLGSGWVDCQHGRLPVPAPATLAVLTDVPIRKSAIPYELTTPTGAAIIKTLAEAFGPMPGMRIARTGYGAGHRRLTGQPNLLRIVTGAGESRLADDVLVLETNIDDMNPQWLGFLLERLLAEGALDVCLLPAQMKKNRPGTLVQVLCPPALKDQMLALLLTESTSAGVRYYPVRRLTLMRRVIEVATSLGPVRVKEIAMPDGRTRQVPEFDDCRRLALAHKRPIMDIFELIRQTIRP